MNKYLVMIEGKNCVISGLSTSRLDKFGFFATRCVEAEDQRSAENKALQMVKAEVCESETFLNDQLDPPKLHIEETRLVVEFEKNKVNQGFTFFPNHKKASMRISHWWDRLIRYFNPSKASH